jgi:type IV pilus assembly protein PilB
MQFAGNTLTVATCDPQNLHDPGRAADASWGTTSHGGRHRDQDIKRRSTSTIRDTETVESIIRDLEKTKSSKSRPPPSWGRPDRPDRASSLADSAPVRKLLNMVLLLAIKDHASDIHFEPFEDEFRIRIKADGVLYEMVPPPRHLAFAITTRIKVMANLDIAERRLPQDGRIELTVGGHPVDLRVSVLPTMFGESVVMRCSTARWSRST